MGGDSPVKTVQRLLFFLIVAATNYRYIYCKPSQKMFKANFPKILRNWGTTKSEWCYPATPKLPNSSGSVEIDFGEFPEFLGTNHLRKSAQEIQESLQWWQLTAAVTNFSNFPAVWWFGARFIFQSYIGNHPSHWLSDFSEAVGIPPTSVIILYNYMNNHN